MIGGESMASISSHLLPGGAPFTGRAGLAFPEARSMSARWAAVVLEASLLPGKNLFEI
jgi:hypothetical protein